jgi:hypothetical protein
MKAIARIAFAAALALALPAPAAEISGLYGTWECRVPGAGPTKTPPIVWIAPGTGAATGQLIVEIDGFARDAAGLGEVTALDGGWFKVALPQGKTLLMREATARAGRRAPSMELKRGETGTLYRCLRLPNRNDFPSPTRKT